MIKRICKDDYDYIAKMMIRVFKEEPWNETWNYEQSLQRIIQLDDGNYTRCYKYLVDEKIVGVLCGKLVTYVDSLELMIEDLYVDNTYQHMGIGSKLIKEVANELKDVDSFTLLTGRDFYSVDFYKKNGFFVKDDLVFMFLNNS